MDTAVQSNEYILLVLHQCSGYACREEIGVFIKHNAMNLSSIAAMQRFVMEGGRGVDTAVQFNECE